ADRGGALVARRAVDPAGPGRARPGQRGPDELARNDHWQLVGAAPSRPADEPPRRPAARADGEGGPASLLNRPGHRKAPEPTNTRIHRSAVGSVAVYDLTARTA